MTVQLLAQQQFLLGGTRMTPQINKYAEGKSTANLDATTFGNLFMIGEPGGKGWGFSAEGLYDPTVDGALFDLHRSRNVPFTLALTDGSAGSPAMLIRAMLSQHNVLNGTVNDLARFDFVLNAMSRPVRGNMLFNTSASGDVTGTAFQLGTIGATALAHVALHVASGTGAFIAKVQSDSASNFPSPTDRFTFATVATGTPSASEYGTIAGAVTDDWWRIVATNPNTRDFAVSFGIQA